jgi:hypothetical protein
MRDVKEYLKDFTRKYSIKREYFEESKIPENFDQLSIFINYSDIRSTCALSSIVLPKYRLENKSSRYFVVIGLPEQKVLYPYVDEYWSFQGDELNKEIFFDSEGIQNNNKKVIEIKRLMNEHFRDVSSSNDFSSTYNNYLTSNYWKNYKSVRVVLPRIYNMLDYSKSPLAKLYSMTQKKMFIFPSQYAYLNSEDKNKKRKIPKEFYKYIIENLNTQGYGVVCYQNSYSYDMSLILEENENLMIYNNNDFLTMMSMMKRTGFVVDFFSGISRLAAIAQCPFLLLDERKRYVNWREYEFEDVVCPKIPIFRNFYIVDKFFDDTDLLVYLANNIINCVNQIDFTKLNHETGTVDRTDDYSSVRARVQQKMGFSFLKLFKGNV